MKTGRFLSENTKTIFRPLRSRISRLMQKLFVRDVIGCAVVSALRMFSRQSEFNISHLREKKERKIGKKSHDVLMC